MFALCKSSGWAHTPKRAWLSLHRWFPGLDRLEGLLARVWLSVQNWEYKSRSNGKWSSLHSDSPSAVEMSCWLFVSKRRLIFTFFYPQSQLAHPSSLTLRIDSSQFCIECEFSEPHRIVCFKRTLWLLSLIMMLVWYQNIWIRCESSPSTTICSQFIDNGST